MFPVAPKRDADADVLAVTGMDTLELVSRLQRSDLDQAFVCPGLLAGWQPDPCSSDRFRLS
jgi:hypothetical protein